MNQTPFNPAQQPADTSIGINVGGKLNFVTNQELDALVSLIKDVLRPADQLLSKKQAIDFASKANAENLILTRRHAKLQSVLVAFKMQLQGLPEEDPLRTTYDGIFDTFNQVLRAE